MFKRALWLLATLLCSANASAELHTLWRVKGAHSSVYLLGSVHMLKSADSALPEEAWRAYAAADKLVMELNLDDAGAEAVLGSDTAAVALPPDQSLADLLGSELDARWRARATALNLEPELLSHVQPWFIALLLEQAALAQAGFDPSAGVDVQLTQHARTDRKPIIGLETMSEQLGLFSGLSAAEQRDYLRGTLDELEQAPKQSEEVVRAWQHGDTRTLARLLKEDAADSPALLKRLTTDRNRRWLPRIEALLREDGHDVLVVVGALHLIGPEGLVALLQRDGYVAVQH